MSYHGLSSSDANLTPSLPQDGGQAADILNVGTDGFGDGSEMGGEAHDEEQYCENTTTASCLDRDGPAISQGSLNHPDRCRPCHWYCFSYTGCRSRDKCQYCHLDHPRIPRKERRRQKRDEVRARDTDEGDAASSRVSSTFGLASASSQFRPYGKGQPTGKGQAIGISVVGLPEAASNVSVPQVANEEEDHPSGNQMQETFEKVMELHTKHRFDPDTGEPSHLLYDFEGGTLSEADAHDQEHQSSAGPLSGHVSSLARRILREADGPFEAEQQKTSDGGRAEIDREWALARFDAMQRLSLRTSKKLTKYWIEAYREDEASHELKPIHARQSVDLFDRMLLLMGALKAEQIALNILRSLGIEEVPSIFRTSASSRLEAAQQMMERYIEDCRIAL